MATPLTVLIARRFPGLAKPTQIMDAFGGGLEPTRERLKFALENWIEAEPQDGLSDLFGTAWQIERALTWLERSTAREEQDAAPRAERSITRLLRSLGEVLPTRMPTEDVETLEAIKNALLKRLQGQEQLTEEEQALVRLIGG